MVSIRENESKHSLESIQLKNHLINLYVSPGESFMPNATTRLFSKAIEIEKGDIVFDIGSGTGPLAIWAAKESSSKVYAVEIVEQQCELIRENIKLNNVEDKVEIFQGSLFDPIPKGLKADVIMADASGIANSPARILGYYSQHVPAGGENGAEVLLSALDIGGNYLNLDNPRARFYFPVAIGLSNARLIMDKARQRFGKLEKKIDVKFPITPEERELILANRPGKYIKIGKSGSKYIWKGRIYEATLPIRAT